VKNNELFVCHFVGIEDRRLSRIARRILEEMKRVFNIDRKIPSNPSELIISLFDWLTTHVPSDKDS